MTSRVEWHGKQVTDDVRKAALEGLRDGGEIILDESNKIAPIDEGTLINSGKVTVDGNGAYVSYDTPYVLRQHEDMTLQHKNGRQGKFLETAFKANIKRVLDHLEQKVQSEV